MDAMDKETQAELDRLEREIWRGNKDLSDILADDVLKDLDAILGQETVEEAAGQTAAEEAALQEAAKEIFGSNDQEGNGGEEDEDADEDQSDEVNKDGLTVGLLITASALCVGIIGVMIYWLENFL